MNPHMLMAVGGAIFVFGVFWRGWTETTYKRSNLITGHVSYRTEYSIFSDVYMALGIAIFVTAVAMELL